jgi:hypothetical protein
MVADFIAWLAVGAVAGFLYGRRFFARKFAVATLDPETLKAFLQSGEQGRKQIRSYRLGLTLGFALIGAIVGALVFVAGWALTRMKN